MGLIWRPPEAWRSLAWWITRRTTPEAAKTRTGARGGVSFMLVTHGGWRDEERAERGRQREVEWKIREEKKTRTCLRHRFDRPIRSLTRLQHRKVIHIKPNLTPRFPIIHNIPRQPTLLAVFSKGFEVKRDGAEVGIFAGFVPVVEGEGESVVERVEEEVVRFGPVRGGTASRSNLRQLSSCRASARPKWKRKRREGNVRALLNLRPRQLRPPTNRKRHIRIRRSSTQLRPLQSLRRVNGDG